jgi:hypothetical protein
MKKPVKIALGIAAALAATLGMLGTCAVSLYVQEHAEVDRVVPLERLDSDDLFASFADTPAGERPAWLDKPVQVHGTIGRIETPAFPGPGYVYLEAGDGGAAVCSIPATVFATSPVLAVGSPVEMSGICDAWFPAEGIVAMRDCSIVDAL